MRRQWWTVALTGALALAGCTGPADADPTPTRVNLPLENGVTTTSASPPPAATSPAPADGGAVGVQEVGFPVDLSVVAWCACGGPDGQLQVKIKPSLTHRSGGDASIGVGNFRLVVAGADVAGWSGLTAAGQAPFVLPDDKLGEVAYIPANKDGWSQRLGDAWTFATHWDASTLPAGGRYLDEGVKRGDLVFYVPTGSDEVVVLAGLALMSEDGSTAIGWAPRESWGAEGDPNAF